MRHFIATILLLTAFFAMADEKLVPIETMDRLDKIYNSSGNTVSYIMDGKRLIIVYSATVEKFDGRTAAICDLVPSDVLIEYDVYGGSVWDRVRC